MSNLFEEDVKGILHKVVDLFGGKDHPIHAEIEKVGETGTEAANPDAPE